jgi:hypothetical protein
VQGPLFFETRCKVCWFEYFLCAEQTASSCRPHSSADLDLDTESDAPSVFMRLVLRSYEAQVGDDRRQPGITSDVFC